MSLASLAADLKALSEAEGAPQRASESEKRLLARAAVDYVLSEAAGDQEPEDIGTAITLAASAAATQVGADPDELVEFARSYLRRIVSGTAL